MLARHTVSFLADDGGLASGINRLRILNEYSFAFDLMNEYSFIIYCTAATARMDVPPMDQPTTDLSNPKVVDILEQVRPVFASKGFDGTSMQDLAQAAGMSVGNFYRYFPSKCAIIQGLVQLKMNCVEEQFAAIHTSDDPRGTFLALLRERLESLDDEEAALWTEMQAASFRLPEIAHAKQKMEETVRANIVKALVRIDGGTSEADIERYRLHAHLILLVLHGFAQRKYSNRGMKDDISNRAFAELVINTLRMALHATAIKNPSKPSQ